MLKLLQIQFNFARTTGSSLPVRPRSTAKLHRSAGFRRAALASGGNVSDLTQASTAYINAH